MQFADGYRFQDRPFNGLGLGAGAGSDESNVQYSYYDYEGSGRPASPVHEYNPAVIADYQQQLGNLARFLKSRFIAGDTIVLRGGGGMGAGAEYLMENGEEFVPHALSTQAGFEFQYEFRRSIADSSGVASADAVASDLDPDLAHAYELLGDFYRTATAQAYDECGRDYANFSCMCPKTHATVLCLMGQELGDPTKIPAWLQQQHCPNDPELPNQRVNGLTSYQHVLLDSVSDPVVSGDSAQAALQQRPCGDILLEYFESVNGAQ